MLDFFFFQRCRKFTAWAVIRVCFFKWVTVKQEWYVMHFSLNPFSSSLGLMAVWIQSGWISISCCTSHSEPHHWCKRIPQQTRGPAVFRETKSYFSSPAESPHLSALPMPILISLLASLCCLQEKLIWLSYITQITTAIFNQTKRNERAQESKYK